jgi:hypothetical protein
VAAEGDRGDGEPEKEAVVARREPEAHAACHHRRQRLGGGEEALERLAAVVARL